MHGSVYECFHTTATRVPNHPFLRVLPETALRYGITAEDVSYGVALQIIDGLRARFAAAGYGPGKRVGLLLENRPAFFFHWIALNALGVSVVPLGAEMKFTELAYLIDHSELYLIVRLPERSADLQRAVQQCGRAIAVMSADTTDAIPTVQAAGATSMGTDLEAECALLYTSGTTGKPKGCVLTNRYFLQAGAWYSSLGHLCRIQRDADVLITPLPMNHMNAMAFSTMVMIMNGGCIVPLDRFHPKTWWHSVRESRATILHYLGVMPSMLMSAPESSVDRDHQIRFGFGAGVDKRLHAPFEQRFGFPLVEAWAMTETGAGGVMIAHKEPRQVGSACFGRATPELEVRLVDEQGSDVPPNCDGELLVRVSGEDPRRGFFREYLKDADATAQAWQGGWFHTGDVVRADDDGNLYFVDRRKNVIRRSGENISAVEVESVLRQHAAIKEVAVAATPDALRGDEVLACVVPNRSLDESAQASLARDLVAHCLTNLAYYKAPAWIAFRDHLPLTASQKVQRGELKKLAAELPGQPGVYDLRHLKRRQST